MYMYTLYCIKPTCTLYCIKPVVICEPVLYSTYVHVHVYIVLYEIYCEPVLYMYLYTLYCIKHIIVYIVSLWYKYTCTCTYCVNITASGNIVYGASGNIVFYYFSG